MSSPAPAIGVAPPSAMAKIRYQRSGAARPVELVPSSNSHQQLPLRHHPTPRRPRGYGPHNPTASRSSRWSNPPVRQPAPDVAFGWRPRREPCQQPRWHNSLVRVIFDRRVTANRRGLGPSGQRPRCVGNTPAGANNNVRNSRGRAHFVSTQTRECSCSSRGNGGGQRKRQERQAQHRDGHKQPLCRGVRPHAAREHWTSTHFSDGSFLQRGL